MNLRHLLTSSLLTVVFLLLQETACAQDAKNGFTSISTGQLKKILDELKIEYKPFQGSFLIKMSKPGDNKVKYDVVVESFNNGQAIVVGMIFLSLEVAEDNTKDAARMLHRVNDWNAESALSRGMRRPLMNAKGKQVFVPRLEADLDCTMGVTKQDINRLIQRFPAALKEFELFLK